MSEPTHRYTARLADEIERRWQDAWSREQAFRQPNPGEPGFDAARPKFYCLDMFPYPSGAGLHVGHPEGYTATDIVSRYKRMRGFNVLHPMGWDAFGLPAEQYAIQTGVHPAITTRNAIENFRRQLQRFGFCYDWSREFGTIDEDYYRWTQWIFLRLYDSWFDPEARKARPIADLVAKAARGEVETPGPWGSMDEDARRAFVDSRRLAYLSEMVVNWCPRLGTVLANDEVIDGRSERGGHPVVRKPLRQWTLRITAYAERLLEQLDHLDWPDSTRTMQAEWIGKSTGAEIEFRVVLGTPALRAGSDASTPMGTPSLRAGALNGATLRDIDDDPRVASHPAGFIPRDPYPEGIYGPAGDLVYRKRNLPHFQLPGATYFVSWTALAGRHLAPHERTRVLEALTHFDGDRCRVYAACVMPDHVHWIVRPFDGVDLHDLCRSVKRFSARTINEGRGDEGRLWNPEAFDHIIRHQSDFAEHLAYLVRNPVAAELVEDVAAYEWTFVHQDSISTRSANPHTECGGTHVNPHTECGGTHSIRVFTTRPDTIFGATYMVIAPEHALVDAVLAEPPPGCDAPAVREYVARARSRSDVERMEDKRKTGVFSGVHARNPATGDLIPVWIADYVLATYGTGAIMAVPAHDQRDFEFARAFDLPIRDVVYPRVVLAMRHFVEHAYEDEPDAEWREDLADFLGVCATDTGVSFADALEVVRTRRAVPAEACDVPGTPGPRRGATQRVWLETLDDLGVSSFADLSHRFSDATFYSRRGEAFAEPGVAVNSANAEVSLNGLHMAEAMSTIVAWLERTGCGRARTQHRLRDWVFSRQRYWGEPFPIVYDAAGHAYPVQDAHLPVRLPELVDYAPVESDDPQPLLAKAGDWVHTTAGEAGVDPALLPPHTPVRRETNTMPGSAGSSWYAIRYCDPRNAGRFVGSDAERYWMGGGDARTGGVDLYVGGSEHAVGHLLYARFWQNVLYDLGYVGTPEPFRKLFHQGLITSFAYQRADKTLVPTDMVDETSEGVFVERATGAPVSQIVAKMSKSLKNVVNPDDVIAEFGADTFRLYEMYMGPLEASKPWNPRDIAGLFRFLQRAWRCCVSEIDSSLRTRDTGDTDLERRLHRLIAKVGADVERLSFNTAIAAMIEFVNACVALDKDAPPLTREQISRLALVLSPFAPHIAEELWSRCGNAGFAMHAPWPAYDAALLHDAVVEVPVQVQGKVRSRVRVPAGADAAAHESIALADPRVRECIADKPVKKVIVVPGRMVNIVV